MTNGQGSTGNVIAAICSVIVPGLGQLVQGRLLLAAFMFVSCSVLYWFWFLLIPAIIGGVIHLWSIFSAARFRGE